MYLKILSGLAGLGVTEETNAGGIRRLRLIPANQLDRILWPSWYPRSDEPNAITPFQITGQNLLFIPDHLPFVDVDVMPEYASYSENMEVEANGEFYRPTIEITVPKDRPAVAAWCHRYRAVRWVAVIQDRNGFNRLVGTNAQPLKMDLANSLGAGKNGKNARILTFSAATQNPAPYLDSIEDFELFGDGPFSLSFGYAYNS